MICNIFRNYLWLSVKLQASTQRVIVSATGAVPEKVVNFWEVVFGVLACEQPAMGMPLHSAR